MYVLINIIVYSKKKKHEKAREDASFNMTLKQEIKKAMGGHKIDAHLNKKKKLINKTT